MFRNDIEARVYFTHVEDEVEELSRAIIPMAEHIQAVSHWTERVKMKRILGCETFQSKDAAVVTNMLRRAANHARINLDNYFPLLHQDILASAERLEEAVKSYLVTFRALSREAVPAY